MPSAPIRFPLLIGISGKRKFDENDADHDEAISISVRSELDAVFSRLDRDFPGTPKILLTGAAFGADLIAAEAALARKVDWAVAAILPFERDIFLEDFDPNFQKTMNDGWRQRYLELGNRFKHVIDPGNPRMVIRQLPKLHHKGGSATPAQISRTIDPATYNKTLRRNHYEQVGQYIAEAATIMIAVMPGNEKAERTEATGGTARIVAFRRAGRPTRSARK